MAFLWETLFSIDNMGLDNILGIDINTYAIYVVPSTTTDRPEAWDQGTFTGELLWHGPRVV